MSQKSSLYSHDVENLDDIVNVVNLDDIVKIVNLDELFLKSHRSTDLTWQI